MLALQSEVGRSPPGTPSSCTRETGDAWKEGGPQPLRWMKSQAVTAAPSERRIAALAFSGRFLTAGSSRLSSDGEDPGRPAGFLAPFSRCKSSPPVNFVKPQRGASRNHVALQKEGSMPQLRGVMLMLLVSLRRGYCYRGPHLSSPVSVGGASGGFLPRQLRWPISKVTERGLNLPHWLHCPKNGVQSWHTLQPRPLPSSGRPGRVRGRGLSNSAPDSTTNAGIPIGECGWKRFSNQFKKRRGQPFLPASEQQWGLRAWPLGGCQGTPRPASFLLLLGRRPSFDPLIQGCG